MRLVFAGTPTAALPTLHAILDSGHELAAVVTRPDARSGRGRRTTASPVAEVAEERGLEVLKPPSPKDPAFVQRLRELRPDCCPVVAYGALVPQAVLDVPDHGWVNLHFSLLPAWRGAAPVQHTLLAGEELTGATAFRLVAELDAGPVYGVLTERVRPDDTTGSLQERLATHGAALMVSTLDGIADGTLEARPQPAEGVSTAPKLTTEDARVRWTVPAEQVDRRVRACIPAPGAWTGFRDRRVKLSPVSLRPEVTHLLPGELGVDKRLVLVGTGTHAVGLSDVQPPGKQPMPAEAWVRGARLESGESFAVE
ncbi:MAG: methionyl-tRNA formyltransferase [Propionibacteriales bacterium]|nr:methionyl-tRNA formyltransferase [Propionibacteriales bacterium]